MIPLGEGVDRDGRTVSSGCEKKPNYGAIAASRRMQIDRDANMAAELARKENLLQELSNDLQAFQRDEAKMYTPATAAPTKPLDDPTHDVSKL